MEKNQIKMNEFLIERDRVLLDKISKNIYFLETIQNDGYSADINNMLAALNTAHKKRIASQYLVNESNLLIDDIQAANAQYNIINR